MKTHQQMKRFDFFVGARSNHLLWERFHHRIATCAGIAPKKATKRRCLTLCCIFLGLLWWISLKPSSSKWEEFIFWIYELFFLFKNSFFIFLFLKYDSLNLLFCGTIIQSHSFYIILCTCHGIVTNTVPDDYKVIGTTVLVQYLLLYLYCTGAVPGTTGTVPGTVLILYGCCTRYHW